MHFKIEAFAKSMPTLLAYELLDTPMKIYVHFQASILSERAAASRECTFEWPLTRMTTQMFEEII